jgi:outer membrane immunogenic protein
MRKITGLLVLAAALATSSVQAADMPLREQAPRGLEWSWTGFYIGINGGYGWSNDRHTETSSGSGPLFSAMKSSGYVVGGHAGFNWQQGMFVGGMEIDATLPKLSGITSLDFTQPPFLESSGSRSFSIDYFGTVRGRVGIVPHQSVLLYATGGLAWAKTTEEAFSITTLPGSSSSTFSSAPANLFGFVAGAGAEASLASVGLRDVILRLEYLHYNYGKQPGGTTTSGLTGFPANSLSVSNGPLTVDTVRAGISIKFWPGS